jgi:hypothetical protein
MLARGKLVGRWAFQEQQSGRISFASRDIAKIGKAFDATQIHYIGCIFFRWGE